jgi:hypothetical protein
MDLAAVWIGYNVYEGSPVIRMELAVELKRSAALF